MTSTLPASTARGVTFLVAGLVVSATLFVPPPDVTPVKPSRKRRRVEDPRERKRMLAAFEDVWASRGSFSPQSDSSSASQPQLVMPVVVVPDLVLLLQVLSWTCLVQLLRLPGRMNPAQSSSVLAPASGGSRSQYCCPSGTWSLSCSRSRAPSSTHSRSRGPITYPLGLGVLHLSGRGRALTARHRLSVRGILLVLARGLGRFRVSSLPPRALFMFL